MILLEIEGLLYSSLAPVIGSVVFIRTIAELLEQSDIAKKDPIQVFRWADRL